MNDSNFPQQLPAHVAMVPSESTNPAAIALVNARRAGDGDRQQTIEIVADPWRTNASGGALLWPQRRPTARRLKDTAI